MFHDVDFDPAEFSERISLASVVREGVPATGCAGNIDRAINPIERERNDSRRVSLQRQFGKLEEITDLG